MQRFEGFLDGRLIIPPVRLIEIDVIGAKTAKTLVEFVENGFAGEAPAVRLVAHDALGFGGDDNGFPACVCFEETAKHLLTGTARINVGGVKKIDAKFERLAKKGLAFSFVESPSMAAGFDFPRGRRTVGHAAKTDARNLEASLAKIEVVHLFS